MTDSSGPRFRILSHVALVIGLAVVASACGPTMAQVNSGPLPQGVTFSGEWFSPQYDNMVLEQKGTAVTGTFSYQEGGKISGELEGNLLRFDWEQPGNMSEARRAVSGKGYWVISDDGARLTGEWGYMDSETGGGVWTAERLGVRVDPGVDPEAPVFGGERSDPPPPME
jgi:hypothetical protein